MASTPTRKTWVFLGLTLALSSIVYYLIIASGTIHTYSLALMWCPGVAAIATQLIFQRNIRGLGWSPRPLKYVLMGYGIPVLYGLVVYGVVWATKLAPFAPDAMAKRLIAQYNVQSHSTVGFLVVYVAICATAGVVVSCATALGEEIGWRGLFVPELAERFSFTTTALMSGIVWALWHYPAILFADYGNAGAPVWFALACFTVSTIAFSFVLAWLRLKSGSVWPAVLAHASWNLFIPYVFTAMTAATRLTPYLLGEFGVGLTLVSLLGALVFWRKRQELPVSAATGDGDDDPTVAIADTAPA